jgi:exo-beta-1,3-glucanase (GH17 family)
MAFDGAAIELRSLDLGQGADWIGEGLCYGPYRAGQRPGAGSPGDAELSEDLALLSPRWHLLRSYGAVEFAENLLRVARANAVDMKFLLGVWIAPDDTAANRAEIAAAIRLANEYPERVVAVCVGNETQVRWSAYRCAPELLIEALREVRARVSVPVTTADDYAFWIEPESAVIAAEIDFVTFHAHPMWNGIELDAALDWLQRTTERVRAQHPDRPLLLGETGWATSVAKTGEQAKLIRGVPGEAEQRRFYAEVRTWIRATRLPTLWFEAFDEPWKGGSDPAEVEKHWGIFGVDRAAKLAARAELER